jgi:hypothetical protein
MGWGDIIGGVAGSIFGGKDDSRERQRNQAYNAAQQKAALKFQEDMRAAQLGELTGGEQSLAALGQRLMTQNMAMATQNAMNQGMQGSIALRGQRAAMADANYAMQQMGYQYAQARANVYANQEYPMILREMPQGNRGTSYGKLGAMIGGGFFSGDED